jgi:hypothetical protein
MVVAPRPSTAAIRRVSTPDRAIRKAPIAKKTVRTIGNSSGSSAIAVARAASAPSIHAPRSRPYATAIAADSATAPRATTRTRRRVSRWRAPRAGSTPARSAPIRPIAVAAPIAVTRIAPPPDATSVPA